MQHLWFSFCLFLLSGFVIAQDVMTVEASQDAGYMLNTIFRQDTCFDLSFDPNTAITGFFGLASAGQGINSQTGIFRNGRASVGIDSGIIISTGFIRAAPGPNDPTIPASSGFFVNQNGMDPDADALQPNEDIFDIATLEFEFIPTTDTITFNYVFFSEQYCQTLNSPVAADAFGLILTRPDGTKENIARLPESGDIVSPFTLKPGSIDEDFFLPNTTPAHSNSCSPDPAPPARYQGVSYDGFSTILQAKGAVIPCGVHKLKVVVLDSRDWLLDSGVLLEAGSFLAGLVNKPEPNTTAAISDLAPVEGCDTALITFTRRTLDDPFINRPLTVKYNVIPYGGPENEAVRGASDADIGMADYLLPPSPFIIPAGDTSATLRIPILADSDFNEGREAFVIRYDGTCDCAENADTFYIQDNVDFAVDLGPDRTACADTPIGLAANPQGGSGGYTYAWSTGETTAAITYLATGRDSLITVALTDECGLMGRDSVFIAAPAITANVDGFYSLCQDPVADVLVDVEGATSYRIELEVDSNGVTTTESYFITGDTTFAFTRPANVRVSVVEDLSGCGGGSFGTAFIRSNEVQLTADVDQPDCPGDAGSIAITTTAGNLDYLFRWQDDATATGPSRTGLTPGEYVVEISPLFDPSCTDRDTFQILSPGGPVLDSVSYDSVRCTGDDLTLVPFASGGSPPYRFEWNGGAGTDSLFTITTTAGDQTITLRLTDDCAIGFVDTTLTIADPNPFSLMLTNEPTGCQQEDIALIPLLSGGTPPFAYDWNDGDGTDSLYSIITAGGTTRYPFAVTDDCGLTLRDTLELTFSDTRATVSGFFSVCNPPFTTEVPIGLSGSGPFTFTVAENGTQRTLTATADTSLTYTAATEVQLIAVTGADGCPGTAGGIANVTDGNFRVVAALTPVACRGDATGAIELDVNEGNSGVFDYRWNRAGLTGFTLSNLTAGTYAVTITDRTAAACTFDTSFVITEPEFAIAMVIDTVADVTCLSNGTAGAFYGGGTGALTYEWSNGETGTRIDDLQPNLYELSVTDENGCTVVQPFRIQDRRRDVLAAINASAAELSCDTETVTLTAAQNTVAVTYAWRTPGGASLGDGRQITVNAAGDYIVEVTDEATGCVGADTLTLGQSDDILVLDLPETYLLDCRVDRVDPTVTLVGYDGPVTYRWRLPDGTDGGTTASLGGVTTPGTYEVTVVRQDNGCSSTALTEVVENRADPVVSVPVSPVRSDCRAPEVRLTVNGDPGYTYEWATTDGNLSGPTIAATTTADRPGNYLVTVTDPTNGCSTTARVEVIQDGARLRLDAGRDQPLICNGTGTALLANFTPALNGTTVRWYAPDGEVLSSNLQTFTFSEGPHVLEVIHPASGCSSFDTVNVFSEAPTAVTYQVLPPPCPEVGGRVLITDVTGVNGPFEFSSPTGETEPFGGGLRGLPEGSNLLIVTDQFGCQLRDSFLVFDTGTFEGEAPDVEIRLGESDRLGVRTNRAAEEIATYSWTNLPDSTACLDCPDPETSPLSSYVAAVTLVDTNGCRLELRQQVIVEEPELLYLPTAFSPGNQDGVNDVYTVFGSAEFVRAVEFFHVYDRWGNRVFTAENFAVNDPAFGWTGRAADGRLAPGGVYVYVIGYQRFDGRPATAKGDFVLMR